MPAIPNYQYRPLVEDDNSRFIQLYPAAQFDDPIRVDLVERAYDVSNTNGPAGYEALSYTWGSDVDSAYIFVAQNSRLLVRRNVTQILRYLRDGIAPGCTARTLWIDAICINQADNDEKGKQVTMMGKIYACATSVLIWTGQPGSDLQALKVGPPNKYFFTGEDDDITRAMKFLETGWFSRRWVVQEVMHAREAYIISGNGTMQWHQLRSLIKILEKATVYKALTPHIIAMLHHLSNLTAARNTDSEDSSPCSENTTGPRTDDTVAHAESMATLLTRYSVTECADGRDRIYALRSLSSTSIPVDYEVSTNELYSRLSQNEVVRYPMAIMSCAGAFGVFAASWIPDWRLPMRHSPFQSSLKMQYPTLPGEGVLVSVTKTLLTIRATFAGVISSVVDLPGYHPSRNYEREDQTLYKWGHYFAQYHKIAMSELKLMDEVVFCCTLRAILIEDLANSQPSSYVQESPLLGEEIIRCWPEKYNTHTPQDEAMLVKARDMGLIHTRRGRSCFFTDAGQFGLGPDSIQVGDCVVSMPGCDSMMALRPVKIEQNIEPMHGDIGSSQYPAMTVVGDCWIPELIKANRQDATSNLRTFHIV
ncbi:heterokaryon incompatibility protein-domain-containing protein [Alternaria rosae]|uniref:heterokaryon incompatibility protein-domain-containing protein n=1 Tax=Alternaria rosae TaxID=1187941 RepID=UPI001E8E96BC|nr:heterokaryon incompatibility protein-domain-containing protein [Alternaria rosae]KAH6881668.1 heterokaryon incompatibility protein-domain-containing protein [Alternaria rosae]